MYVARDEMQKKNLYIPIDLIERAETVARSLNVRFSQLVREAVHQFVERSEKEAEEKELAQACRKSREFNKRFSSEWSQYETRLE